VADGSALRRLMPESLQRCRSMKRHAKAASFLIWLHTRALGVAVESTFNWKPDQALDTRSPSQSGNFSL
jgi:hypothetical protein